MTTISEATSPSTVAPVVLRAAESAGLAELVERSQIDASTRGPVLMFFATAIGWLLLATTLGLIASIKLHAPEFLSGWPRLLGHPKVLAFWPQITGDWPFLSYGRIYPAFTNALTYGWGCLAGLGVAVWLMARLCRVGIRAPGVLIYGGLIWNIGVAAGVVSIILGEGRGLEGLEMPPFAHGLMFIGFVLIGLWGAVLYRYRRQAVAFISVWYLLGALFWFPWIFATANVLLSSSHLSGVMQSVVGAWYFQNLQGWWFTSIGLAAAYFFIPKVIDRPVHSYNLASLGFWTFAIFSGLTGMVRLSGGPIPAWMVTLSISATIMMLVPISTVSVNLLMTMRDSWNTIFHSPTLRFIVFGTIGFVVASLLAVLAAPRSVDSILHFTPYQQGQQWLLLYSFFSMVMFGAIYYITPRLVACEWLSSSLISFHFLAVGYGGTLVVAMLVLAGVSQGLTFSEPESVFTQIFTIAGFYNWGRTIGFLLLSIGHAIFALHFILMLLRIGQPGGQATLFATAEESH